MTLASAAPVAGSPWPGRLAALRPDRDLFIDGRFTPAADGARLASISPRDGSVVADVAAASAVDVDRAVRSGLRVFEAGIWSQADPLQRRAVLLRLAALVEDHREDLALLETAEVGKPITDTLTVDIPKAARTFAWYAEAIDKTYDEVAPVPRAALALVTREPLGVIGAVVPWNYPLLITSWKLAPALAAGNSVVLKPSEESSLSALLLARLATEAGLPDGVLNVVPGAGPVAGAAIGQHPSVAKVTFTGSPMVGHRFLAYAAGSGGKQVSLELGGKSPHVVLADADLTRAAEAIWWGFAYNAGQTCNAGTVLIAVPSVREELLARIADAASRATLGDPLCETTQIGPLAGRRQQAKVTGYLRIAAREGGRFVVGGIPADPDGDGGCFVPPVVVDGLAPESPVVREEIFGPVLTVLTAPDTDTALALANRGDYGLAAAVWTRDLVTAHRAARALRAGTVWVNTFDAADVVTPFGGFKGSGAGRDRSLHALDGYTNWKTTWIDLTGPGDQGPRREQP